MNNYNLINDIKQKNKYKWNTEEANNNNFFVKKLEFLYFRNYNAFCWSFIPAKCRIINYFTEKEKKDMNEHLKEKTISEQSKNEIIQKINIITKAQEDANKINQMYEDLKKKIQMIIALIIESSKKYLMIMSKMQK